MNRRQFLRAFSVATASGVVAPVVLDQMLFDLKQPVSVSGYREIIGYDLASGPDQTAYLMAQRMSKFKAEILRHAVPRQVLGITGKMRVFPAASGEIVTYKRWAPPGFVSDV